MIWESVLMRISSNGKLSLCRSCKLPRCANYSFPFCHWVVQTSLVTCQQCSDSVWFRAHNSIRANDTEGDVFLEQREAVPFCYEKRPCPSLDDVVWEYEAQVSERRAWVGLHVEGEGGHPLEPEDGIANMWQRGPEKPGHWWCHSSSWIKFAWSWALSFIGSIRIPDKSTKISARKCFLLKF